jgi:Flp pilus assembly protein TadG
LVVLFVPVFLGFMGFAIDLGRFYMARAELKTAASAMALAAAGRLIGTDQSTDIANTYAQLGIENSSGFANRYDFAGSAIGQTNGSLASEAAEPLYYASLAEAIGGDTGEGGTTVSGATAKYVRINLTGEVPVVFWSFLPLAQDRRVALRATAVAGISAPLCTACAIEPIAAGAVNPDDTTDFGFTVGTRYTFGYQCLGQGTPGALGNGGQRIPYVFINRLDANAQIFTSDSTQLLRIGAQGLPGNTNRGTGCLSVNAVETIWESAQPQQCLNLTVQPAVQAFLCGLSLRFDTALPGTCSAIPEADTVVSAYTADTDVADIAEYASYTGNGKRILTIPIVDSITNVTAMTVLGFRQFLLQPAQDNTTLNVADTNGRFAVTYLGSVKPLRQGTISGCQQSAGPGKVVLHR